MPPDKRFNLMWEVSEEHTLVEGNENLRESAYCEECGTDWPCKTVQLCYQVIELLEEGD